MGPYAAQLRTLYQCRPLWLWHIIGVPIFLGVAFGNWFGDEPGTPVFFGLLVTPLWCGVIVVSVMKDITRKPMTFCIPDHGVVSRRLVILLGVAMSAVCALLFLPRAPFLANAGIVALWSAFALGFAAYLTGVLLTLTLRNLSPAIGLIPVAMFVHGELFMNFRLVIARGIMERPVENSIIAALLLTLAWRRLAGRRLARTLCGESFLPVFSVLSTTKSAAFETATKTRRLNRAPGRIARAMEGFFLSRMRARSRQPGGAYIWGTLYYATGNSLPASFGTVVAIACGLLFGTIVLGYYTPLKFPTDVSVANFVLLATGAALGGFRIATTTDILLPIDRGNRFRSLVFAALVYTMAAALIGVFVLLASRLVDSLAHEISLNGTTHTYVPVAAKAVFYFLTMLPLFYVCQLAFPQHYIMSSVAVTVILMIVFVANAPAFLHLSLWAIALLYLACWVPFVAVAHHRCYSRDLGAT